MSARQAAPLKPRGVLGLLDASFEIARTSPGVLGLSMLGMAPVASLGLFIWYGSVEHVLEPPTVHLLAAVAAALTLFRYVPAGAASRMIVTALAGDPATAKAALGQALRRSISLMTAGAVVCWVVAVSTPLMFLPLIAWSGVFLAVPLVMEREASPWGIIGAARRLLGDRVSVATGLTVLWLLGVLFVAMDLAGLVLIGMWLATHVLDVDTSQLTLLLSPANPIFFPAMNAVALVLLEPVRQASVTLLFLDARVRKQGLDLAAAVDALPVPRRRSGRGTAVAGILLAGLVALPVHAQAPGALGRDARVRIVDDARWAEARPGNIDTAAFEKAVDALPAHDPALTRLADDVEADLAAGHAEAARHRLRVALGELRLMKGSHPSKTDPRALAASILKAPEFHRVEAPKLKKAKVHAKLGWWERFLRWIGKELDKAFRGKSAKSDPSSLGGGVMGGVAWLFWIVFIVAVVGFVAVGIYRALGNVERVTALDGDEADEGDHPKPKGDLADALARAPDAWLADADTASAEGRHRDAVRLAFLALLSALHRARAIDFVRAHTNWDHVHGFKGSDFARETFEDVTRRYEFAWYGMRPVTGDGYQLVRASAQTVVGSVGGAGLG